MFTSTLLLWIILIWGIFAFIKYHWTRRRFYKLAWSLNGPVALPIIGDALRLLCKDEDILNTLEEIMAPYSSPIKFWLGPKLVLIFSEVNQIEKIMLSMKFAQKDKVYRFMKSLDGDSLITGSGPKWKRDRKLLTPIFTDRKKEMDQQTFDVEKYIHRCAADIISELLMGEKPSAQFGGMDDLLNTIRRIYILVHSRIAKAWLHTDFIFNTLGYGKIQEEGKKIIHGFMGKWLETAKSKHEKSKNTNLDVMVDDYTPHTIIDQILHLRDEIPDFATDQELIHHLTTFYTASEDPVTIILSFTLVLLGMYPIIQNKVYEELQEVFGSKPQNVHKEDLAKLKYLHMCIQDIMRLFPIAPFLMREASEDFEMEQWVIPKGCSVIISIYNLHRSTKHWEKPNDFYPEHFLPEAVRKRHPYAFIPFSAGPRGCIGKPLAYMAIKTILATVLQHYRIEADGTLQEKKLKADITVRFKEGGYPIRIKHR